MRNCRGEIWSETQVERIEQRRQELGVTRAGLHERFATALKDIGCVHEASSARMRLDRVLNPHMRKPVSETTKIALARALDWTLAQLEQEIGVSVENAQTAPSEVADGSVTNSEQSAEHVIEELRQVALQLEAQGRRLQKIARGLAGKRPL